MMKRMIGIVLVLLSCFEASSQSLDQSFLNPPNSCKPWTYWFWINGNMTRDGITKDLEAMKRVGINGVLWMEVSGPYWAPQGPVEAGTRQWYEMMQWAIAEADRLAMDVDLTVDFGYGTGGPHITPDTSMQRLVWSETEVVGGKRVGLELKKPTVDYEPMLDRVWLRPGTELNPVVLEGLQEIDSYRDIAVFAIKVPKGGVSRLTDSQLSRYDGRGARAVPSTIRELKHLNAVPRQGIVDLTDKLGSDGTLNWSVPKGEWQVVRLGHASNFQMTRPSPGAAVGLECDRLNPRGIEAHFKSHLQPILDAAGDKAGRIVQYVHVDSWEAHGQNWTAGFAEHFKRKRGYDIEPWLPVLTGIMVENESMTTRFLWDMRLTVSELMLENYIDRLRELLAPYGVKFSSEPYGNFGSDSLTYGGRSDLPIAEFWTPTTYDKVRDQLSNDALKQFAEPIVVSSAPKKSLKSLASVANTYGRRRLGAEAFTGSRAWGTHPWLIKGLGDHAFAQGINHFIYHLSAHQAYDNMVPGLTHRRWGLNFQRHQTWWEFSKPYFDYVARCQILLQQGYRVADIAFLPEEGAPVRLNHSNFLCPDGYDYDDCSVEIVHRMEFKDGRVHLPSGVSYRYLLLPKSGRLTLETAQKVEALRQAGSSIYRQRLIVGTPGMAGFPKVDEHVQELAKNWPVLSDEDWQSVLAADKLPPDFQGDDLNWLHRRSGGDDIYFLANPQYEPLERVCCFRATSKVVELWNPETGDIFALPDAQCTGDQTEVSLSFGPAQSWFVVFRDTPSSLRSTTNPFPSFKSIQDIDSKWALHFDPNWGSDKTLTLERLVSWSEHADPRVKYYSGTGTYRTVFDVSESTIGNADALYLDFGKVAVMARVKLNGQDCGCVWKPPYRVDVSHAVQSGQNELVVEVANTWANRLIGDEQLPLDGNWKDWEVLLDWPDWFTHDKDRTSGRLTFTSARHYEQDDPLPLAGLLGPVQIVSRDE